MIVVCLTSIVEYRCTRSRYVSIFPEAVVALGTSTAGVFDDILRDDTLAELDG